MRKSSRRGTEKSQSGLPKKTSEKFPQNMRQYCLIGIFLLGVIGIVYCHGDSNGRGMRFIGDEYWLSDYIEQCDRPKTNLARNADLFCHTYHIHFEQVNVEIMSREPLLLVYRDFATPEEIQGFLNDANSKELELQKVLSGDGTSEGSSSRQANGTWIGHEEYPHIGKMYHKAQRLIPNVNFAVGEQWQVLSYHPGGHYAPHYDFLEYEREEHWDWWMKEYGNRFATFLLVLKTAKRGGGTVFPKIDTTVQPSPGDVIFWLNMNTSGDMAELSLHGGCPIYEGQKIAATIWIRKRGQEILTQASEENFDTRHFTDPKPLPQSSYGMFLNGQQISY